MLEKEFDYYLQHQQELLKSFKGKFIVIVGEEVIGHYRSNEEALYQTRKTREMGTFLIQHCTEGESAYTYTFHSHVVCDYE